MKVHSFDVEVAMKVGVPKAVLLYNLSFWIDKNRANNRHFIDGHYWTYNTAKAFSELMPYFNSKQIYRMLDSLEEDGYILKGKFNKDGYDQTTWYTVLENGNSISRKRELPFPENGNCTITDNKPDSKHIPSWDEFKEYGLEYAKKKSIQLDLEKLEVKYDAWVANGWKDGYGKPIKVWKSKVIGSIPYMKKDVKESDTYRVKKHW